MKDFSNNILKLQFKSCQGEIFIKNVFNLDKILNFKKNNYILCFEKYVFLEKKVIMNRIFR